MSTTVLQRAGHTTTLHMSSEGSSKSPGGSKFNEGPEGVDNNVYTSYVSGEESEAQEQYQRNVPLRYGNGAPSISSEPRLSSWADLDLSVVVALVSPIGSWLTGGDHIKNIFLIVLLIFYLHQLIQGMLFVINCLLHVSLFL